MSLQFAGYNTIAYDEIDQTRMGSATSFYTTFQQLMLSVGICAGAATLQGAMVFRGDAVPRFADFSAAFWAVALISLSATIWNRRFAPDAGTRDQRPHAAQLVGPPGDQGTARADSQ